MKKNGKRFDRDADYLHWANDGAQHFKRCSRRQYMAIVLDKHGRLIGSGYNGTPPGMKNCTDGGCPHATDHPGEYKLPCYAVHAEANALIYADTTRTRGGAIYVNGLPCLQCALMIIGAGITKVVCFDDRSRGMEGPHYLERAGVEVVVFQDE